jgi:hypothetical protein
MRLDAGRRPQQPPRVAPEAETQQCPHCGGALGESHVSQAKVPFETDYDSEGKEYTRWETLAVHAWRCTACRRVVRQGWGDGRLYADAEPYEGPLEFPTARAAPPAGAAPLPTTPADGGDRGDTRTAAWIAFGIVVFSILCLLSAMGIGYLTR